MIDPVFAAPMLAGASVLSCSLFVPPESSDTQRRLGGGKVPAEVDRSGASRRCAAGNQRASRENDEVRGGEAQFCHMIPETSMAALWGRERAAVEQRLAAFDELDVVPDSAAAEVGASQGGIG